MPASRGSVPSNKLDRTGREYGKLTALKDEGNGRWLCLCMCGNTVSVLSTNMANMAKNNRGCRHCANRQDITGQKRGLLTALYPELDPVRGRQPLWTFHCRCGNTILGTVREFHAEWLRSCGCIDSAFLSWRCMMNRCYKKTDPRYKSYGGRGIKVCPRWHRFANFLRDMGERPKRHNLGRLHTERGYGPSNCHWEHVSLNCRDTKNDGEPTRPGRRKGALPRIPSSKFCL
jgi:hypothetical protein